MKSSVIIVAILLVAQIATLAQRVNLMNIAKDVEEADSLRNKINLTNDLRSKALLYQELCWHFKNSNLDSTEYYANAGIAIAEKIGERKIVAGIIRFKGIATWNFMHHNKAIDLYKEALAISQEIGDWEGEGYAYDRIGVTYYYQKQYSLAYTFFIKAIQIFNKQKLAVGQGYGYSHLSWVKRDQGDFASALHYGHEALRVRSNSTDVIGVCNSLGDLGMIYKDMGKYQIALEYFNQAYEKSKQHGFNQNIAEDAQDIADTYLLLNEPKQALKFAQIAFHKGSSNKNALQIAEASKSLYLIFRLMEDYKKAFHYQDVYHAISDSLSNDQVRRNIMQQEIEYNYEKAEQKLIERQNYVRLFLIGLILMVSVVAFLVFIGRRRKQKDNELLHFRNQKIQEQKQVLEQQALQLEQTNSMKNKLFSIISHDLKTPFAHTGMLLKLVTDGIVSDAEFKEILPRVNEQIKNSSALLDNLLLWAKNQMEGYAINPEKLNLFVLIENHVEVFKPTSQNKSISIHNNVHPSLCVEADKAMVEIIVRNLISNALKFCEAGDKIDLNAYQADDHIVVSIEDTGKGIPKDKLKILFKGYVPSAKGTANESGTGLGLMLCKDLIEKNKGKIWVESTEGNGTCFYFSLPIFHKNMVTMQHTILTTN